MFAKRAHNGVPQRADRLVQPLPRNTGHMCDPPPGLYAPELSRTRSVDESREALDARGSYTRAMALERISIDPARMGGLPTIRDTRVTVAMVLGQLATGRTVDELVADYPYIERADVLAALEYAAAAVNEREIPVARPA